MILLIEWQTIIYLQKITSNYILVISGQLLDTLDIDSKYTRKSKYIFEMLTTQFISKMIVLENSLINKFDKNDLNKITNENLYHILK